MAIKAQFVRGSGVLTVLDDAGDNSIIVKLRPSR